MTRIKNDIIKNGIIKNDTDSITPTQSAARLKKSASHHLIDERCCSGSSTLSGSAAEGAAP